MPKLIDDFLKNGDIRPTIRNWEQDIKNIIDGYRSYTVIPHAVQKDAIQNGWSARANKKGKEWYFKFELIEKGKRKYLIMSDSKTTGLTGRVLKPEEYEMDLPSEEKWGRFEGVAFTQDRSEKSLGSRGRGKFVFVGASKEMTILYDTLRADGTYRFGFRTVKRTESPIAAWDDDLGRKKILEITNGAISPLENIGTRVIIVDPIQELIESLKNGDFAWYIAETWWEIIFKNDADIAVGINGNIQEVGLPQGFDLVHEDSEEKKYWLRQNQLIKVSGQDYRVKNLHIVYDSNSDLPDEMQGIAIQRGGMKICTIKPTSALKKDIADKIYGYINFDMDAEEELLEDEGIEHYSFDYRKPFPKALKRFIEDELLRFAREKLGYGIDAREKKRREQQAAERKALEAANNFAKYIGIGVGPRKKKKKSGTMPRPAKKIRIQMDDLGLTREGDLRVNYGEKISNIKISLINDTEEDIKVRVRLFLRYYDKEIKVYQDQDFILESDGSEVLIGPYEEIMTQDDYPDQGKYTFSAKIISLRDEDKGYELDRKTKSFYLEEDPPMYGLFERCEALEFPDEEPEKYMMGYSEFGGVGGLVLYYNVSHPGYAINSETEDDLAEYILRIASHELCRYDLMQEEPVLFKEVQKDDIDGILRGTRNILGEVIYKFRKGIL